MRKRNIWRRLTGKFDWRDHAEKEDYIQLMDSLSMRSWLSEDLTWAQDVCFSIVAVVTLFLFCFVVISIVIHQ